MAQDVESIVNAPLLTTSGGISMSQIATFSPGDSIANDNPYAMYLAGNLNFNMFGTVNVPLTFALPISNWQDVFLYRSIVFP